MDSKPTARSRDKATLFDRLAIGLLSGILAFVTGTVLWLILAWFDPANEDFVAPFETVLGFTAIISLLGFLLLENFLAEVYGKIWQGIWHFVVWFR